MKSDNNYVFIDSQNLNLAIRSLGWTLDFAKLRVYLRDKFSAQKCFLFIGYIKGQESLYTSLQTAGFILIFKPTLEYKGKVKGNCDAELVMHAMIEYANYDKAIIISGDGDFHCLIKYLENNHKLYKIGIPNKKSYSSLLREYQPYFFYISDLKKKLEHKKGEHTF